MKVPENIKIEVRSQFKNALKQNDPTTYFDKDYILVMVDKETFNRWEKVPNGELKLKSFIAKELAEFEQAEIEPYVKNCTTELFKEKVDRMFKNGWNEQV